MLSKQKTNTVARKQSKYNLGLQLQPAIDYKGIHIPERPPRITGQIIMFGKIFGGKSLRYYEMNPIEGNIIMYTRREDCPKIPKEINRLSDIINLTPYQYNESKEYFSFEVMFLL